MSAWPTHTYSHKHHLNIAPSPSLRHSLTEPAELFQHLPHHWEMHRQHFADDMEASTSWPPTLGEVADEVPAWMCARGGIWLCGQCLSGRTGKSVHGPHGACPLLLRPHCYASFREKTLHAITALYLTKPTMRKVHTTQVVNNSRFWYPLFCRSFCDSLFFKLTLFLFNCSACESKNTNTGLTQTNST